MTGPEVVVLGALHHDVVVDAPHLPALDETVNGRSVAYRFGGKGGNQAVAAARMGARVAMIGRVGEDAAGDALLAALDAAGIDRSRVARGGAPSGMSVAIVTATGEYGAVIVSGANHGIEPEALRIPVGARWLLLQNEIPAAVNAAAIRAARAQGTAICLNAAPAEAVDPDLVAGADILVVNRVEAAALAGDAGEPEGAAASLLARGPSFVVVTLGPGGLVFAERGAAPRRLSAPKVPVASTHGAGDAFTGSLVAELARGASLADAVALAQAAAALLVATPPDARDRLTRADVIAARSRTGD